MPFWVHGRDAATDRPRDSLFIETDDEADARKQAADAGMMVEEVEFVRPAPESGSLTAETTANLPPEDVPSESPVEEALPAPEPPRKVEKIRCARCNSDRVVPRAHVWDRDHNTLGDSHLQVYVYSNPDALVFKGTTYATLYARVCGNCGHAELFAAGADELYRAYQRGRAAQ